MSNNNEMESKFSKLGEWGRNVLPGWKNRLGVLLAALTPFAYLLGQQYDIEAINNVMDAMPGLIEAISIFGVALARVGYLWKVDPE